MNYFSNRAPALIAFCLVFCACEQQPPETPPEIELGGTADFAKIGKYATRPLSGNYRLTANITVASWTPPGSGRPFTGTFNGAGHTVTITGGANGLFDTLSGATVRNLNVDVRAAKTGGSLGGVAAYATGSLIENCTARVTFTLTSNSHNNSAGGIVGTMGGNSTVRGCTASGAITLTAPLTGEGDSSTFMVYAGGIAGYSGTPGLAGSNESGCLIEGSSWTGGTVSVESAYPYAGGVVGYNYSGAAVRRCWSSGAVRAAGGNLPYAGGVAGYNSRIDGVKGTPSTIADCYSTAAVTAVSSSRAALAGGVAGANAAGAVISRCYATGAVTAQVNGAGTNNLGGSVGVMVAANAGGIAGAQYVTGERNTRPTIEHCAALNVSITGVDSSDPPSGAVWNIYRIAGAGSPAGEDTGVFTNNTAWSGMVITNHASSVASDANGKDGADCGQKPAQTAYTALGWDFGGVWRMSGGYPVLR
jgi:hypothetical protein